MSESQNHCFFQAFCIHFRLVHHAFTLYEFKYVNGIAYLLDTRKCCAYFELMYTNYIPCRRFYVINNLCTCVIA